MAEEKPTTDYIANLMDLLKKEQTSPHPKYPSQAVTQRRKLIADVALHRGRGLSTMGTAAT